MARHPDWFQRLDAILDAARGADVESLGRVEIRALFGCAERDSIRLLHRFGATKAADALSLPRALLVEGLESVRASASYTVFLRKRRQVAKHLEAAHADHAARRQTIAGSVDFQPGKSFADLPAGVHLEQGRIICEFTRPEDFWAQIDALADIAAGAPEDFEKAVSR